MNVTGLRCVRCGAHYDEGAVEYTCPPCGIEGILDVEYAEERVRGAWRPSSDRSIWRYLPMLPIRGDALCPRSSWAGRRSPSFPVWRSGSAWPRC